MSAHRAAFNARTIRRGEKFGIATADSSFSRFSGIVVRKNSTTLMQRGLAHPIAAWTLQQGARGLEVFLGDIQGRGV